MSEDSATLTDLLGDPWAPLKDMRGRKAHKRRKELAENIAVLRASGLTKEQIATRIGLDVKTLDKYYSRELDDGPTLAKALLIEAMWQKAIAGNAAAAKLCLQDFDIGKARRLSNRPEREPKSVPLGKKEERRLAAQKVVGLFATPQPPKLIVDND